MPDIVISAESLGKKYIIDRAAPRERYSTLRDAIAHGARRLWQWGGAPAEREEVWALRDVSFEVGRGEVVGIIGRNGAGKSTLLKILSRITEPTTGQAVLRGRVASLLEIGTGFHPELTGRENVYLNGSVLGLTRAEIRARFDEIVAFAEVERFLDTPVKRYSSGMYVRLAFAVAAHLEAEILVVDEVLAVGDAGFQRKCLGKMQQVGQGGRTVLFVSHNMAAVESLTQRSLLLDCGLVQKDGPTRDAVAAYLAAAHEAGGTLDLAAANRKATGPARIVGLSVRTERGEPASVFRPGETFIVTLDVDFAEAMRADVAVVIENARAQPLFATHLSDTATIGKWRGRKQFMVRIRPNLLRRGAYLISLGVFSPDMAQFFDVIHHLPAFSIEGSGEGPAVPVDDRWGDLYLPLEWTVRG
jgi:lipopolysaccharide transport system ATP-binding protein